MRSSADAIAMITRRNQMTSIGAYDKVVSTSSRMDDPSAHVLEYRYYLLSMSVFFALKDILGLIIFVSGGSKDI